jgi:hypothetical protein
MTLCSAGRLLTILTMIFVPLLAHSESASPTAQTLIEELNLTESTKPIAEQAGWNPKRVAVMLIPALVSTSDNFETELQKAAGDVELVFDRSGSFVPAPELLIGTDGVIGFCTPPMLKNADARLLWVHNYSVGMEYCTGASDTQIIS